MSVFDLPRLHFAGIGVTRLPTDPRSGLLDRGTHAAVAGYAPFPVTRPAQEYQITSTGRTYVSNRTAFDVDPASNWTTAVMVG